MSNTPYIRIILLLFIQFIFTDLFPRQYNKKDGLSSNFTYSTLQDQEGFVWIVTRRGIDRFDGSVFDNFNYNSFGEETESVSLALDSNRQLVLLTNQGSFFRFNYDKFCFDQVAKFTHNGNESASKLYVGEDGIFWFSVSSRLYGMNITTGELLYNYNINEEIIGIETLNNHSFIAVTNKCVYKIENNRLHTSVFNKDQFFIESNIKKVFLDSDANKLWIGTAKSGLFNYDIVSKRIKKIESYSPHSSYPINDIALYKKRIYLATSGAGLIQLCKYGDTIIQQSYHDDKNATTHDNSIYDIMITHDSAIVFSNYRSGITILGNTQNQFKFLSKEINNPQSLHSNQVGGMLKTEDEKLWFGTTSGISEYDPATRLWKEYQYFNRSGRNNNQILSLVKAGDTIWMGSSFLPFGTAQIKSDKILHESLSPHVYMCRNLLKDKNGNIWFSRWNQPLYLFDKRKNKVTTYPIEGTTCLYQDERENIVIGTNNGVYKLSSKSVVPEKPSLWLDSLNFVKEIISNNGTYWLATVEGLYCATEDGIIKHFTTAEGLTNNNICSMIFDNDQNLWISTEDGINMIDKNDYVRKFRHKELAGSMTFTQHSAVKDYNGIIYFGSNEGIVYFDPQKVCSLVSNSEELYFKDLFVNFERVVPGKNSSSILKTKFNDTESIILSAAENTFSISFSQFCYDPLKRSSLEWKLDGYHSAWTTVINNHLVCTQVPTGKYCLFIRDSDSQQIVKQLSIEILPPFWKSTSAYLIYIICFIGLIYLVKYLIQKKYEKKHSEEVMSVMTRTVHDIKTPLTLIQASIEDLFDHAPIDSEDFEKLMIAKRNTEKIYDFAQNIIDMRKSKLLQYEIKQENFDLIQLLKIKVSGFEMIAKRNQVNFNCIFDRDELFICTDPVLFDRIFDNLISNALKYKTPNQEGQIILKVLVNDKICISLTDDGIGIHRDEMSQIFRPFTRSKHVIDQDILGSGLGLSITKNFVTMLHGNIKVNSKIGKGSCFSLEFPLSMITSNRNNITYQGNLDKDNNIPNILLVEDHSDFRTYLARHLTNNGYSVIEAVNGHEALGLLDHHYIDLIISDNDMPVICGVDFTRKLKNNNQTSHIPVLMLSGLSDEDNIQKALTSGVDIYLTKPIGFDIITAHIKGLFENRRILKQKFAENNYTVTDEVYYNETEDKFIRQITDIIFLNISNSDFNVADLSQEMGMSRTSLYNKLKSLTGIVPNDFIRTIRLRESQRILNETSLSISEVAYAVGFSDPKYFSTCFKKHFGITPSEYIVSKKSKGI
ncbi:MAG: response regulator [Bacteroidales bacterium]